MNSKTERVIIIKHNNIVRVLYFKVSLISITDGHPVALIALWLLFLNILHTAFGA